MNDKKIPTTERIQFRLFETPCCHMLLCWVNPRLPNRCPECGEYIYIQLKSGAYTLVDSEAFLKYKR